LVPLVKPDERISRIRLSQQFHPQTIAERPHNQSSFKPNVRVMKPYSVIPAGGR